MKQACKNDEFAIKTTDNVLSSRTKNCKPPVYCSLNNNLSQLTINMIFLC